MPSLMVGALDVSVHPYRTLVGTSMGAWAAVTSETTSLFLDGSVVSGEATGNREIPLLVRVVGATRSELIAACEALIGEANKASNTITFTPDVGPSVVYEVFRARAPERVDGQLEGMPYRTYSLSFPALPFARSATREAPAAAAPAIRLEDFEAATSGAYLIAYPTAGTNQWTCPVGSAATTPIAALVATTDMNNSLTAVTNVTSITYPTPAKTTAEITATAAGLVEVRTSASWTVTGDLITVAVRLSAFGAAQLAQAGVEWLDSGGATLRTDWGTPMASGNPAGTVWAVSGVPALAVSVRVRLRVPAATAGQVVTATEIIVVPSALATVTVTAGAVHDGVNGKQVALTENVNFINQSSSYLGRSLSAPVSLSTVTTLSFWVKYPTTIPNLLTTGNGTLSVRLFDSAGRWSRWWFTGSDPVAGVWKQFSALLSAPYESSDAGPVDLTDVVAYDADFRNLGPNGYCYFDTLIVTPTPTASTSPRGTVYALDPILGSARTVAAVTVSSATALTDWLIAAIDGTDGPPLLAVTTNVATVTAPAGYDGVYSVLGCIAPATVLAAPTCTIVQKNAGVTVATRVLTGTTRVGNRYVDFGACELPLVATPVENVGVSYTFTLAPSSASWVEVLVIDVDASLAWVDNQTALKQGWIDEPDIVAGLGKVWVGTLADKSDASALALPPTMSRPLQVKAPSTRLLVYSTTIAPDVALSYYPRWLVEPS